MRIAVHTHHTLRKLCEVEIPDDKHAHLLKPPPLKDNWVETTELQLQPDGTMKPGPKMVNLLRPEAHIVRVDTPAGELVLYPCKNLTTGQTYFVTPTHDIALANAA